MNPKILKLGISNIRSIVANNIYLKTGLDFTYPVHIYATILFQCNSLCKMCTVWRHDKFELPASVWIKTFKNLRPFIGSLKVSFTGGEVLLKKDIFEIFEFCNKANIIFGITTNAILLDKKNVERLIDLKPFNINISVDSVVSEIYHEIRGVDALDKIKANIDYLMEYKEKVGSDTIINIKSIVCKENLGFLDKTVEYAKEKNFTGITFDPIVKVREEAEEMFKVDKKILPHMIDKLIQMKKEGYNILNSEESIRQWVNYFDDIAIMRNSRQCLVPLRSLYIFPKGNVKLCEYVDTVIGNIKNDDIKSLLHSKKTRELKKEMVNCKRSCAYCVKRTIKDYFTLVSKFITPSKKTSISNS